MSPAVHLVSRLSSRIEALKHIERCFLRGWLIWIRGHFSLERGRRLRQLVWIFLQCNLYFVFRILYSIHLHNPHLRGLVTASHLSVEKRTSVTGTSDCNLTDWIRCPFSCQRRRWRLMPEYGGLILDIHHHCACHHRCACHNEHILFAAGQAALAVSNGFPITQNLA